jgi:hypothetical protein
MDTEQELVFLNFLHDQWLVDIPDDYVVRDEEAGGVKYAAVALKMLLWTLIVNREDPERAARAEEFMKAKTREVLEF